jgi:DNA-binding beta-propeller fold protein YncE
MGGYVMKNYLFRLVMFFITIVAALCFATDTSAKVEWEILKDITLDDNPRDITISRDGSTAYILCSKSVQIYSIRANKVTETIPLKDDFSQIAISPDGEQLFLTKAKVKELSIIQISQVYNIEIGTSPVIGKADAPVKVFAFLDYQ